MGVGVVLIFVGLAVLLRAVRGDLADRILGEAPPEPSSDESNGKGGESKRSQEDILGLMGGPAGGLPGPVDDALLDTAEDAAGLLKDAVVGADDFADELRDRLNPFD